MTITRRDLLRASLLGVGALAARPAGLFAGPSLLTSTTSRASRLFGPETMLAHADLHNHTLQSDGAGDPALAYASMRNAGLDIAALTDHSTLSWGLPQNVCPEKNCQSVAGINEKSWADTAAFAAAAHLDGSFVAIRGFEWSSPTLGHINVWGSQRWTDPLHTGGGGTGEGAAQFAHDNTGLDADTLKALDEVVRSSPVNGAGMAAFYEWLTADPARPIVGGGADGIAGFNHPGREPGRFSNFRRPGAAPTNIVSIEVFNRGEDYLFEGTESIAQSPINEALNAGWRVGLAGVTDEHGTQWGVPTERGRTGVWVASLTRSGVADAMRARRIFATRERGLRIDAAANGVRMGGAQAHPSGPMTFSIDIDRDGWVGKTLMVQVLRSGSRMPRVQHNQTIVVPASTDPVVSFTLPVDRVDGDWVVLRITDPSRPADARADATWASFGRAVAYASPFFLD